MAERIVIHIGAPKTGTTFLQAVLFHNQDRLAREGVLVPGTSRRDHGQSAGGLRQGPGGKRHATWEWLVGEAHRWPGTVVISNEWFAMATAEQARAAVDALGAGRTHVVFTARDLVEQVPAAWQETIKLGRARSLDDFLARLDSPRGRWRWSVLDAAEVLGRWRGDLPASRVSVVTVPPKGSDPSVLLGRFASVCDFDPAICEVPRDQARESLSTESAALLMRLGPLVRAALDADNQHWSETYRWIQRYLSHQLLSPRRGSRIALSPDQVLAVRERSEATARALAEAGYDVVGDLAELNGSEQAQNSRHPRDVTEGEMLDVALPLIADLVRDVRAGSSRTSPDAGDRPA